MQQDQAEITQQNQQELQISGAVNFVTVPVLLKQAMVLLKAVKQSSTSELKVDMSKITESNSAGLAFMLEVSRQAHESNMQLHFENLPDTLLTVAKAYGVEGEIRELCQ